MRPIKFRGIDEETGDWVFGYYFKDDVWTNILVGNTPFKVDPETVGQFIGRPDKNGKEIYEGDVVKGKWSYCTMGVIAFDTHRCVMYIKPIDGIGKAGCDKGYKLNSTKLEIVGNIHDNPELIK